MVAGPSSARFVAKRLVKCPAWRRTSMVTRATSRTSAQFVLRRTRNPPVWRFTWTYTTDTNRTNVMCAKKHLVTRRISENTSQRHIPFNLLRNLVETEYYTIYSYFLVFMLSVYNKIVNAFVREIQKAPWLPAPHFLVIILRLPKSICDSKTTRRISIYETHTLRW